MRGGWEMPMRDSMVSVVAISQFRKDGQFPSLCRLFWYSQEDRHRLCLRTLQSFSTDDARCCGQLVLRGF